MVRNILDHLGNIVGTLELPDGTSEDEWTKRLAPYALPPTNYIPDVTPRQFRQALVLMGISETMITDAFNTLPEPYKSLAFIEWEYSIMFIRSSPLVAQVGVMLGWTSQQLDDLWIFAKGL